MIQLTAPAIVRKFSKFICTTSYFVSVGLSVIPSTAQAAGADGNYRVVSGKGSLIEDGKTLTIPKSLITQVTKDQSGAVVVKGQKMKITQNMTRAFLQPLATGTDIRIDPKITGPQSIKLLPVGNYFSGKTFRPVVTNFSYVTDSFRAPLTIQTDVVATVKGNTLTLTIRYSGLNDGSKFNGVITLVGKR